MQTVKPKEQIDFETNKRLLNRYRFKSQPYATSRDLVEGLYSLARDREERDLIRDLFEKITVWDLKAEDAKVRELGDGRFETTLTITATKFYADGQGVETESPLNDRIEIGAFSEKPGAAAFAAANVIRIERLPVRSGRQQIKLITDRRPAWIGIDAYNTYIDRNSDDNLVEPG